MARLGWGLASLHFLLGHHVNVACTTISVSQNHNIRFRAIGETQVVRQSSLGLRRQHDGWNTEPKFSAALVAVLQCVGGATGLGGSNSNRKLHRGDFASVKISTYIQSHK